MSNNQKVRKKTLGSYPYFSVIFSVTLALYILGLFSLLLIDAEKLSKIIKENFAVYIYLTQECTPEDKEELKTYLQRQTFVAQSDTGKIIHFVSKEEAAKEFIQETGEDFYQLLGTNPLHDAFEVKISEKYSSEKNLKVLKKILEAKRGVFEVSYKENMIDVINENLKLIKLIFVSFASILMFAIVLLMNNTIKLALFSQRFLIRSMQLVGATGGFIQKPFFFRGVLNGLLSGVFASLLLSVTLEFAHENFVELKLLYEPQITFLVFGILPFAGAFVCSFSTIFAIRKYMRMSLDKLY